MPNVQETILEVDLSALKHNFKYLKSKLKPNVNFLAVVKSFAYGSDSVVISKTLVDCGVDYLAVAYTPEGVALRKSGIDCPILVLHPQPTNFQLLIENCLEPSLYSLRILKEFLTEAERLKQKNYPVHINFNTGLNRLGFKLTDLNLILEILNNSDVIFPKYLFSHLAASEDLNELDFTTQQINSFERIVEEFETKSTFKVQKHLCNTSGVLNFAHAHFDMVRCGIGLYGFGNSATIDANLIPVARLKSVISQIHTVEKGESVGYNRAYTAKKVERTATIPIGHADGIGRQFGNGKGFVIIKEKKAPIIGNVCMDMLMVNVTDIECNEGDLVIIFDQNYKATTLAESCDTISYEILTAVSQRVKRVFLE